MKSWAAPLIAIAVLGASCSLPSFEERQARAEREIAERDRQESPSTTSEPGGSRPDGVVLGEADPTADLPDPGWVDLRFEAALIAQYVEPISVASRSGTDDLYVAERGGIVRRIQRSFNRDGEERIDADTSVVLDIADQVSTDSERGLLDIEFSLDGRSLFVSYTDLDGTSVIAEYDIDRSTRAAVDSRRELLRVPQPFGNHNGGNLEVGADGFLYIGLGDGGSSGDPEGNGQNTDTLLGSVLRIDPVGIDDRPYLIPDGNPFADGGGAPEVFLYGVRNPWRFSFDSETGDLWLADVGQNEFEEINMLSNATEAGRGANLGWNRLEAFEPYEDATPPRNHTPPIYAYAHEDGRCSITGGAVYRGELMPLLDGVYVFGDFCTGELFGLAPTDDGPMVRPLSISLPQNQLVSIDADEKGELYLVLSGGDIVRLEPLATGEASETTG